MDIKKGGVMSLNDERFLSLDEVMTKTGLKRSTIYNQMRLGRFPKNIEISSNRIAWLESEVIIWMTTKINQRNNN